MASLEPARRVPSAEGDVKGILGTVRNATLLLELLSQGPPIQTVTGLAERSGLSVATAHRVLRSLAQAHLVRQSSRSHGYGLGSGLVRLAECYLADLPVVRALSSYLVELRNLTGATIEVCLLVQGCVLAVDRVDGPDSGVFRKSSRKRPTLDSAAGRVLLADADLASSRGAGQLADSSRFSEGDALQPTQPFVAVTLEEVAELQVAVPVRDRSRNVVAALLATTRLPPMELSDGVAGDLARHLLRAAEAVQWAVADE